jgi:hypothetical protein
MMHYLLSLRLLLSPLSSPIALTEPLKLSTGLELEALYVEPSDQFCLSVEHFAMVKSDLDNTAKAWMRRLESQQAICRDHLNEVFKAHRQVHEGYVAERHNLKRELVMVEAERKDLKKEVWWLRVGGSVVLVLGAVTITSLLIAR